MLLLEVTYRCVEQDEDGRKVEGENACHLRVKEDQVSVCKDGLIFLGSWARSWIEHAIEAVERLQGREYVYGSICDVRLVNHNG